MPPNDRPSRASRKRLRPGCSAQLPCPLRLRSRDPVVRRFVSRAPASPASPSVRRARRPAELSGRCLFHHREYASEAGRSRTGSRLRSGVPVRGGKHFATTRGRSGRLRPAGSDAKVLSVSPSTVTRKAGGCPLRIRRQPDLDPSPSAAAPRSLVSARLGTQVLNRIPALGDGLLRRG